MRGRRDNACGLSVFFFNDTATTEIYTLSLHDALPIWGVRGGGRAGVARRLDGDGDLHPVAGPGRRHRRRDQRQERREQTERSEEHTSELQSRQYLVCRLLLEKKNKD